jgi:hypothetical protein
MLQFLPPMKMTHDLTEILLKKALNTPVIGTENEQSPLASKYDVGNSGPGLVQAQKYGRVKPLIFVINVLICYKIVHLLDFPSKWVD